ncbi:MAG: hypothetical protein RJQ21_06920 [Rhodospirillales bacterium]
MRKALIALPTLGLLMASSVALAGPNCTCRYAGADFGLGACTCITISGKSKLACCDMVMNNTSWKFGEGTCPVSQAPEQETDTAGKAGARPQSGDATQQAELPENAESAVK